MSLNGKIPLANFELSSEIYILICHDEKICYTARSIRKIINQEHKDNISINRVRQILRRLAKRGHILTGITKLKPPNTTIFYQATCQKNTVIFEGAAYNIMEMIIELKNNGNN